MPLELWHYPLLFLVGLVAGTVDAVAGGGGLITVPALLNLGLPVPLARVRGGETSPSPAS